MDNINAFLDGSVVSLLMLVIFILTGHSLKRKGYYFFVITFLSLFLGFGTLAIMDIKNYKASHLSEDVTNSSSLEYKEQVYDLLMQKKNTFMDVFHNIHVIDQYTPGHFDLLPDNAVVEKVHVIKKDKDTDLAELTIMNGPDDQYKYNQAKGIVDKNQIDHSYEITKEYALIPNESLNSVMYMIRSTDEILQNDPQQHKKKTQAYSKLISPDDEKADMQELRKFLQ